MDKCDTCEHRDYAAKLSMLAKLEGTSAHEVMSLCDRSFCRLPAGHNGKHMYCELLDPWDREIDCTSFEEYLR